MSDSDEGWQRPKKRKTKEERLMAPIKAVMRDDRSSSRKSSRGRSHNRSRNGQRKGSKGPRSRTRDPTPVAKKEKATHSEGNTHRQEVATCQLRTKELDDTQGVSPVPHKPPMSIKPNATQGDGIGLQSEPRINMVHGPMWPPPNWTKCPRSLQASKAPLVGFRRADNENLVKYKIWPNNTQKSLHPSQKTCRKTTLALVRPNEHERLVAGRQGRATCQANGQYDCAICSCRKEAKAQEAQGAR